MSMKKNATSGLVFLVAGSCLLVPVEVRGALIQVDYWRLTSSATDVGGGAGTQEVKDENVRFPLSESLVAEAGPSRAVSTHDFQATDSQVVFRSDFQQQRGGVRLSPWEYDSAGNAVIIYLTTLENSHYEINGLFTSLGPANSNMFLWVYLIDASQHPLFEYSQSGIVAPGQEYHLGGEGATGMLRAGQHYVFSLSYSFYPDVTDSGATASGWSLFEVTPEPTTGLGMLLLMSVTFVRFRRESR